MPARSEFDYAIIRVAPRVEREEFINAGVILICRTAPFLGARIALDRDRLAALAAGVDLDLEEVEQHLAIIPRICQGDPIGGEISTLPLSARFHWLVAPRSTVIQVSPVHSGLCHDPEATLTYLLDTMVRTAPNEQAERQPP